MKWNLNWNLHTLIVIFVGMIPIATQALTLEEFLQQIRKRHRLYQSLEVSQEAAENRYTQGNLALSPILSLKGSYTDDKALQQSVPSFIVTHQKVREYSLGLGKRFSTGTSLQGSAFVTEMYIDALSPNPVSSEKVLGGMGISLSQSLWKDGFGKATHLRWEREENQKKLEMRSYNLQAQQILVEAELVFWDLVYQEEELNLRLDSLARAKKIENWIHGRVRNGIGEKSDLLNAQSLVATRELQLLGSEDELTALQKKITDMMEESNSFQKIKLKAKLENHRSLKEMIGNFRETGRVVRLDTYLAILEAKVKQMGVQEVDDSLLPDLSLEAGYRTNIYQNNEQSTGMTVINHLTDTDKPTTSISLKLNWLLDGSTKETTRRAVSADALAARLKRDRKILESESGWLELRRRYDELTKRIIAAKKLNKLQSEKAKAEKDRLNRGRTVTSLVITAEQDAAEAELMLARLHAEQRKLEAQARMFVVVESLPE